MATDEMYSVNDLAYRWGHHGPSQGNTALRDLGLGQIDPPWTDKAKALVKVRIAQAVDEARALLNTAGQLGPLRVTSGKAMEGKLSALCDRHQLMGSYAQVFGGPEPHLYEQGSDAFLKAQFVHVSKGQIGWFDRSTSSRPSRNWERSHEDQPQDGHRRMDRRRGRRNQETARGPKAT